MKKQALISAGKFKAICLKLMDEVQQKHQIIIITKHGKPVAKLVPIEEEVRDSFGCMKNSIKTHKDIISPIKVKWDANL